MTRDGVHGLDALARRLTMYQGDRTPWELAAACLLDGGYVFVPQTRPVDYEQMRRDRHWPTPNHMRTAADALDSLTPARYGDILRWFADLCDEPLISDTDR